MADRFDLLRRAVGGMSARLDGWMNEVAGLGTSRDKAAFTRPKPFRKLPDQDLRNLYRGDDMAARIVDAKPDEALKKGWDLHVQDEDSGDTVDAVMERLDELGALKVIRRNWRRARLYGGSAIVVGADDGQPLDLPLREDRIRDVRWLQVVDRRYLHAVEVDDDPESPAFGEPTVYEVTIHMQTGGHTGAITRMMRVHASRMIIMKGVEVDEEADTEGWGDSVLQRAYEPLRQFQNAWLSASHIMTDMSQAVLIMDSLNEMIAEHPELLEKRMMTMDRSRSVSRMVLLNQNTKDGTAEKFEKIATSLAGVPDMLLHHGYRLSAAAHTPITILMGISPPGSLNNAGETEGEWWRDTVMHLQEVEARPAIRRLTELVMLGSEGPTSGQVPESWDVRFPPLRQMDPKQEAEIRLQTAQADASYIDRGVLLAEEVALSRYTADGYSTDTTIDREAREKLLELAKKREQEMAENPPMPPPGPPQPGDDEPEEDDDEPDDTEPPEEP